MTDNDQRRPFDAVRVAAQDISHKATQTISNTLARPDPDRQRRAGIPEVVYGASKTPADVWSALEALAVASGRALASRCDRACAAYIEQHLRDSDPDGRFTVEYDAASLVMVAVFRRATIPATGGAVGVISAGTSDAPYAAEAAAMAREMGCSVMAVTDVGVAGLHRLVQPLEELIANHADVLVVAAGMDGALPSVIAGLVDVPVIGLPTSTGYGFGGQGIGALTSMLQSCAPGLAVVNIDNGIGAGSIAALIANRVATARGGHRGEDLGDDGLDR